jgi:hypothetical protein
MKLCCTAVLIACIAISGCSKDQPSTPTPPTTCTYTTSSTSQSPAAAGGTFSVAITKTAGSCTWAATSNASWVTFSGPASGSDSATLNVAVAPNTTTSARAAAITITWNGGTVQIAVNQAGLAFGDCTYSFASPTQTVPAEGGDSSAALSVNGSGCTWNVASDASWLTITSQTSGVASAAITFKTTPNPDATTRAGSITATYPNGSTKVTVTQAGISACVYTLSPSSQNVSNAGGALGFVATRNTPNGCSWAASTTTPWITLNGPTTGLSGATIGYTVQANTTGSGRSGAITVVWSGGNLDFVVTQAP